MSVPFWTVTGLEGRCGVSRVTLLRWKRTRRLPAWAVILIRLLDGELAGIDPAFAGWIIRRGMLVSPENWCFSPAEVRALPLLYSALAAAGSSLEAAWRVSPACGNGRSSRAAANDDACGDDGVFCEPSDLSA